LLHSPSRIISNLQVLTLRVTLEEEPLIKDDELAPKLAEVLSEIFETFDQDHDGALNNQELGNFIFTTNGSHPPSQFLVQIAQKFGGTERYWLTKEGFLVK
jgi:Ca2+-binding EF-hand superfamily protein